MTVNADVAQMFADLFDDSKELLVEKQLKSNQVSVSQPGHSG